MHIPSCSELNKSRKNKLIKLPSDPATPSTGKVDVRDDGGMNPKENALEPFALFWMRKSGVVPVTRSLSIAPE